jgi:hypothetical protein
MPFTDTNTLLLEASFWGSRIPMRCMNPEEPHSTSSPFIMAVRPPPSWQQNSSTFSREQPFFCISSANTGARPEPEAAMTLPA